jgi:tetratricopeptide (TPR) repeat protein
MHRALELGMDGHGQIVAVMAEAGTGKSRLFHEFKAILPAGCKVLEAYSVSHGTASPWLPLLDLLRGYFGLLDADDVAIRRQKIRASLAALDSALSAAAPYLWNLFAIQEQPDPLAQMDAQVKRERTLETIKRIVLRESLEQPLVLVFEDLHWIDRQTQALLDLLADSLANVRMILLVNYRPEYSHEWANRTYYTQLKLDPLLGDNAAAMLAALVGSEGELAPLRRMIIERTGGNPFFIEEMLQALFDEGALIRNGTVKVMQSLSNLRLPSTVQGILASRIDRQPGEHKQLLQTLAVLGSEAPLGLIRQVVPMAEVQLGRMLADLQAGEFIYEQPATTGVEYVFKHALTQEVAYNSLLIERRKLLHERAGQGLESMFAGHLDDHLSELARHYSHSDNVGKAIEYLGRAGQQALQRSAHDYAISNLTAALDLLRKLPENPERIQHELMLQLPLGQGLQAVRGYTAEEAKRAFTRALELCERLGDRPELFRVLWGLFAVHLLRGERREAHRLAKQLLLWAEDTRDSGQLLIAHGSVGVTLFEFGEYLSVREHLEKGISFYDCERDRPLGLDEFLISALSYLASTLNILGYPGQALKRIEQAIAAGQKFGRPFTLTFAVHFSSFVLTHRREARAAQEAAERVIELSTEHGFAFWLAQATSVRGEAIAAQGRTEEGIAEMLKGLAAMHAIGFEGNRAFHLAQLAKAYSEVGRLDEALSTLEGALAEADQNEERKNAAERLRLKGELLLRQSDAHAAETRTCFERAIEIARTQGAKWFELRARMSLARLLARQSDREQARTMLAEIYNWFTEGFDTADLKDAKALLDELSR